MPHATRVRVHLECEPIWEGPIKNWAASFIRREVWRCDRLHGQDDLLQEAHLLFWKLTERYPRVLEPAKFMGLFKKCLTNLLNDKSSYISRRKNAYTVLPEDVSAYCYNMTGETTNTGYLSALLSEAPQELKLAIAITLNEELQPPENLNMKLRRILGLADTFDLKDALYDLLFN